MLEATEKGDGLTTEENKFKSRQWNLLTKLDVKEIEIERMTFWPNEDRTHLTVYGKVMAIECKPTEEFEPEAVSDFTHEGRHYRVIRQKDASNVQTWAAFLLKKGNEPVRWGGSLDRFEWSHSAKATVQVEPEHRPELPSKSKRRMARLARDEEKKMVTVAAGSSGDPPPPPAQQDGPHPGGPPADAPPQPPARAPNPNIPGAWDPNAPRPPPDADPNQPAPTWHRDPFFPMCPKRQQPAQPILISGHGYHLKNIARRSYDERGQVHTLWLDEAFATNPTLPIPPELPHEVIFGDKAQPEKEWTILRLPDNMPGSRARFANEYQSGHQRVANNEDYSRFPRDAATDEHLAEADMHNLYRWLEREWGWNQELAEGVFHLNEGRPDSQGLHRARIDTEEEWRPEFAAQSTLWDNNLQKVTGGFTPSCSGPNAMATLHVLCIAIGYIPNLNGYSREHREARTT